MLGYRGVLLFVSVLAKAICGRSESFTAQSGTPGRTTITFDYGWQFKLGDPATAVPKLTTASEDPSFNISTNGTNCTQLAWSQLGRMADKDCRGACSATPGCLMWQYRSSSRACYIHDGTLGDNPICTPPERNNTNIGERRLHVPPLIQHRTGVTWKDPGFNTDSWSTIDVPHDFIMLGRYSEAADSHHGYLPRDQAGWYRKRFNLPAEWASSSGGLWIHFEGVFQACDVFVNGQFVLRHTSGYLGFDVPLHKLRDVLHYGNTTISNADTQNVIAIRVDASFGSGHWYEGGGLVRKSYLIRTVDATHFVRDGLQVLTSAATVDSAHAIIIPTIEAATLLPTGSTFDLDWDVHWTISTNDSTVVATALSHSIPIPPGKTTTIVLDSPLVINSTFIRLWSIQSPVLYTLCATLVKTATGAPIDTITTTFGLRSIEWSSNNGFQLNNKHVHIRGFSHHSDFGGVGAAVPDRFNLFRAQALRSVGGNTWRTSHNPYRPAVYDILDALGVLVWDENRDFNQLNVQDMEDLVRRDRNHPSVVIWSACNEIECFVTGNANVTGQLMRNATKKWDTTRPFSANQNQVTKGINDTIEYLSNHLDVEGFSHGTIIKPGATMVHGSNPHKAVISSECCSCQSQRGEDFQNATSGLSYPHDLAQAECLQRCMNYSYPNWYTNPSSTMGAIAGTLGVWTLFDYAGEPGPWPLVGSSFGQFDYAGFAKSASYWYRALWLATVPQTDPGRPELPTTHVVRISQAWEQPPPATQPPPGVHCNYTAFQELCPFTPGNNMPCLTCCRNHQIQLKKLGCIGYKVWPNHCMGDDPGNNHHFTDVQVFSDAPTITLFLNGKSVGSQSCTPAGFANFANVKYAPGNLTAVGYAAEGTALARHEIISNTGVPHAIQLSLDAPSDMTGTGTKVVLDGHDAALVRATIVDINGNTVINASNMITFTVTSGPGRIAGVHNGNAFSHEPQVATKRSAYHGLARAVVKVTVDSTADPLVHAVDAMHGDATHTVKVKASMDTPPVQPIVVRATVNDIAISTASLVIPTSTNVAVDGPLAVARSHRHRATLGLSFD